MAVVWVCNYVGTVPEMCYRRAVDVCVCCVHVCTWQCCMNCQDV